MLELGVATRPKQGETFNGDAAFWAEHEDMILLAVIDGIGHGETASSAAARATAFLGSHKCRDVEAAIAACHQQLRGSRGAVMGLASIDTKSGVLTYAGIGNIDCRILQHEPSKVLHLISMNGIVGCNLRKVKEFQYPCSPGDIIIMFSDGISSRIDLSHFLPAKDLQAAAERILQEHGKDDDATILLLRLPGASDPLGARKA